MFELPSSRELKYVKYCCYNKGFIGPFGYTPLLVFLRPSPFVCVLKILSILNNNNNNNKGFMKL